MKYFELTFTIEPYQEAASDVLSALLADTGCETFVNDEPQLHAYIQQSLYNEKNIKEIVDNFPFPDTGLSYALSEPEDRDWNEEWEQAGFQDITVGKKLLIHDAHLPLATDCQYDYTLQIEARQAFGTGTHQTTRMLLTQLLDMPLAGLRVIDAGCGTGILGMLCLERGARRVLAYDIDEWSVNNTLHNAQLNHLATTDGQPSAMTQDTATNRQESSHDFEVRLGDSSVIENERDYDLVIANINRNILLGDMEHFANALKSDGGQLLLSGFYTTDVPYLVEAAKKYSLHLTAKREDEDWTMLLLSR